MKPLPGHAIINLGDAVVKFTNGNLKSAKHRVVPAPGEQGLLDRYSVVYFVRPCDNVRMEAVGRFKEEGLASVGWEIWRGYWRRGRYGGGVVEEEGYTVGWDKGVSSRKEFLLTRIVCHWYDISSSSVIHCVFRGVLLRVINEIRRPLGVHYFRYANGI